MNMGLLVVDYYISAVESGLWKDEAEEKAINMAMRYRKQNEIKLEEYAAVIDIIHRLARM